MANDNCSNSHYSKFDNFKPPLLEIGNSRVGKPILKTEFSQILMSSLIFRVSEILSLFNNTNIVGYLTPEFIFLKTKIPRYYFNKRTAIYLTIEL